MMDGTAKIGNRPAMPCDEIERYLTEKKYEEARAILSERLADNRHDRHSSLYLLLVNVLMQGPARYEEQINGLRSLPDLDELGREIIRRIFVLAHDHAVQNGREKQAWFYQRLLRRLLLKMPLDISNEDAHEPAARGETDKSKEPVDSNRDQISDHKPGHRPAFRWFNIFGPSKNATRTGSVIVVVLFGLLMTGGFCFWMVQGKSTAATVESAPRVEPSTKTRARPIAANQTSAQSKAKPVVAQGVSSAEKNRDLGASMISWDFVLFFIAILFWSLSLFLVRETVRSQKSTLATKAGLLEPFSGVEMSQWISCLIVLLWFARGLFSHPGQDPFQFLLDLVLKPEQLTPGIALAIFPPLVVGIVKLVFALGITRGENDDQPARDNQVWVTAVFLALHLACGFGATLLLARFVA